MKYIRDKPLDGSDIHTGIYIVYRYEYLQREGVVVEPDEGYACLFFFKKD